MFIVKFVKIPIEMFYLCPLHLEAVITAASHAVIIKANSYSIILLDFRAINNNFVVVFIDVTYLQQ